MSKKQLHSRLETLFSGLAENEDLDLSTIPGDRPISTGDQLPPGLDVTPAHPCANVIPNCDTTELPFRNTISTYAGPIGYALENGRIQAAAQIWTETGKRSLALDELMRSDASDQAPAAIAVPLHIQGIGDLLLEVVDESKDRQWSEDDRLLVLDVAAQLALALDHAQLYMSVQQELAERIRAEQTILRRNKDLATLNQIGQQLSRLNTRAEIFDLLARMVAEVLDNHDLMICTYSTDTQMLSFPVCLQDGRPVHLPERALDNEIPDFVIRQQTHLLITHNTPETLREKGIAIPNPIPASLLAIPMIAGGRSLGAMIVQDFQKDYSFDSQHVELLTTATSQATTAIENADLIQQMQIALDALENREKYQASVARSATMLSEFGTKALADVLRLLGEASRSSRVYYAQLQNDEHGIFWSSTVDWVDPAMAYLFDQTRTLHMPVSLYSNWAQELRLKGYSITQAADNQTAEAEFLNHQHICTSLLLAIEGSSSSTPGFIAFDQFGSQNRFWQNEEINALRVAADALSNTFVREGLLNELQLNLDETESLYKASNRLALANDRQEMVQAILSSFHAPQINRAALMLFEYDSYGKLAQIVVGANWYSGHGAPPPPVGTEYLRARYERLFQTSTPVFLDDIRDSQVDPETQEALTHQRIRSMAIIPMWIGKRQTGALLLQSESKHLFSSREMRTYPPLVDQMAISVENQRLFQQSQIALSETELLYGISIRIAQATQTKDLINLVVETLLPSSADRVSLIVVNSGPNGEPVDLEIIGTRTVRANFIPMAVHFQPGSLPIIKSLTDEPMIIIDIQQHAIDSTTRQIMKDLDMAATCLVPLRTSGNLIGLLVVSASSPVEFSQEEIRLLRVACNGIAVALEKQTLLHQTQRRALELQTASEIARDTASTLSLDLLLNRITNLISQRFGFDHAGIYLMDENKAFAVIREATGTIGNELKHRGYQFPVGSQSAVGMVTASGKPLIIKDVSQSDLYSINPLLEGMRSEMCIPLKIGTTIIGVLDLQSRIENAFQQEEVTVLQILSDQIAIAIENAQAYELSQKAIEDMKEIDRVKSQFLANMSHELRTPLNSIIGFSKVIMKGIDGPVNEIQKQDLNAIYNSGQHLLSLINDVLDLSKIEAGKMELAFSEVNLVEMINSAMSTAIGLVKDKPIELKSIIPDSLPPVWGDGTRLRQVLINFLSNAAKFTDTGIITVEASQLKSSNDRQEVMISVTDSGPGISPGDQAKLFLPFSQVDDSPTRKSGGTGLGLSICRSLIDLHGGRIGLLRSEIGVGSTFFFALPVIEKEMERSEPLVETASNLVIAIDDDPKVISLYERFLKPHGYSVASVTDPQKAVDQVRQKKPFAITLDIAMPGRDGWDVIHELKSHPDTRSIPVIICSIQENQEKGFSMGAADYLVKPFLQEDILNALGRLNQDGKIRTILAIDDDPDDLRLVEKMFEGQTRYHLTTLPGGVQGWKEIQARHPDALILDLFMPEMNGFQILENLRANPALRHIPVLVLSGADLTPAQHQQLSAFGQAMLSKGYLHQKELLVLLEEALRKFNPSINTIEE